MGNSLSSRLLWGASLWIVLTLLMTGVLLSSLFASHIERAFNARLLALLESLIAASEIENGQLSVNSMLGEPRFQRVYSGWYWQIDSESGSVAGSRSLWDHTLPRFQGERIEGGLTVIVDGPEGEPLQLIQRQVNLPRESQNFYFSIAGTRAEIDADIHSFNAQLASALVMLGIGLMLAVLFQIRYGLQPLQKVRQALADIRNGYADSIAGEYPVEIKVLTDEINKLIDHNKAFVERARTHVGNLAHALKTPLAALANESQAPGQDFQANVARHTAAMRKLIDHHLMRARAAASKDLLGANSNVRQCIGDLERVLKRIYPDKTIDFVFASEGDYFFRGELQDLEEMLGNLIENACKWARHRIEVGIAEGGRGGRLIFTIDDDGPGLPQERRDQIFARGKRLDETVPGSGLGLSIVRDIAELYDGEIQLEDSSLGGVRAVLSIPGFSLPQAAVKVTKAKGVS